MRKRGRWRGSCRPGARKELFTCPGNNTYEQVYGEAALANIPAIMAQYNLFVCNQHNRIRYPKNFDLPDVEAARAAALRVAKVFMEVVPYWNDLLPDQQTDFIVEIDDEGGQTVLIVPFNEAKEPDT
jgi:hypothetical protein